MGDKIDTVLKSWYLLESVQPKELPKSVEVIKGTLFMHQEDVPELMPVEICTQKIPLLEMRISRKKKRY